MTPARAFLAGLLLVVGCATTGERPLLELTAWQPPPGQSCGLSGGDFPMAAILDSAAAAAAIEELSLDDGALLLTIATDSTGARSRFRRIETTYPGSAAERLERELEPLVGGRSEGSRYGRLLVETAGGSVARMEVGPSSTCRPVLANPRDVERALNEVYRELRREGTANVWLFVDSTGAVSKSQVNRGTGNLALDRALLLAGRTGTFRPALRDREAVPVWVAIDLTVEVYSGCSPADSIAAGSASPDPCGNDPLRRKR